jgi:hypothetical protein
LSSGPRRLREASLGEVSDPAGLTRVSPWDLAGSPGSPCGARVGGDFCPGPLFGFPPCPGESRGRSAMQPFGGQRFPAIAGAFPSAGFPGLLELGPPFRPCLPGAGRLHVRRTDRSTSRRNRRRGNCRMRRTGWEKSDPSLGGNSAINPTTLQRQGQRRNGKGDAGASMARFRRRRDASVPGKGNDALEPDGQRPEALCQ